MKALVLAAGLGTRLRPHSGHTPKALFPVGGRPLLGRVLTGLRDAGCREAAVNTHHLAGAVAAFVAAGDWGMPVRVVHEPEILGTGGAIRNLAGFWDDAPFMVVNADVVSDIDPAAVYRHHAGHPDPATLALVDAGALNTVAVDAAGVIVTLRGGPPGRRGRTFTGIQVLDPVVLDYLPPAGFAGSIEAFERMQADGHRLRAFDATGAYWADIGTPERYRRAAAEALVPGAFRHAHGLAVAAGEALWTPLAGDGSQRRWFRLQARGASLVLADHGLHPGGAPAEVDAFVAIGRHLSRRGVPVPRIRAAEPFAGQVLLEDLGDVHLQAAAAAAPGRRPELYRRALDMLLHLHAAGARGFDPAWCHQTPRYDREVVVEAEGRYFLEAYVCGVAGRCVDEAPLVAAFEHLARCISRFGCEGFMHRDLQSRNLMLADGRLRVIDFQGGRLGPLQYDLASLLIDPYVALPEALQERLLDEAAARTAADGAGTAQDFRRGYRYCALARNLQILGAFGHLSRAGGKPAFAAWIPPALAGLKRRLARRPDPELGPLRALVETR